MMGLAAHPDMVRNVAIVGHLHHGKTSLVDMLVYETHKLDFDCDNPVRPRFVPPRSASPDLSSSQLRYTDTHSLAQSRAISIKSSPMSLVLPTTKGKSYLVNLIDTPGHINFVDEMVSGIRVADGAVVVVDAVEGVLLTTTQAIQHLVASKIPIVVVVNKVDRLILELRLPPGDAYIKLKQTIEEVNTIISSVLCPQRSDSC